MDTSKQAIRTSLLVGGEVIITDGDEKTEEVQSLVCDSCKQRRDKYQAIGLTIFAVSLCSCGTLTFFAVPAGFVVQMVALRKCKACRTASKKEAQR